MALNSSAEGCETNIWVFLMKEKKDTKNTNNTSKRPLPIV